MFLNDAEIISPHPKLQLFHWCCQQMTNGTKCQYGGCHHPVEADGLCIFHLPKPTLEEKQKMSPDQRQAAEQTEATFREKFFSLLESLENDPQVEVCDLRGFYFPSLDCGGKTFSKPIYFASATFSGETRFLDATFSGEIDFFDASFSGETSFDGATFNEKAYFSHATFSGETSFSYATFNNKAYFSYATFSGASFHGATFSGEAYFNRPTFNDRAYFWDATFSGETSFDGA
ncbi:MAG TPA: pentapeptide repeat-containing protein, partial [Gammaproteobacteria bacterium]|nr:pentapeptide repeat-containing protein [Gammaproteobacteria bacterium]